MQDGYACRSFASLNNNLINNTHCDFVIKITTGSEHGYAGADRPPYRPFRPVSAKLRTGCLNGARLFSHPDRRAQARILRAPTRDRTGLRVALRQNANASAAGYPKMRFPYSMVNAS
jgi:hypothetical protein